MHNYSYFLMKPDGGKHFTEINKLIKENFKYVKYFAVENWSDVIKKLYYKHYEEKGEKFAESFDTYLNSMLQIYDNNSVLLLVSNGEEEYSTFLPKVVEIKKQIREQYENKNLAIAFNNSKKTGKKCNYIRILSQDGKENKPRCLKELGDYRLNNLNVIHCPDSDINANLTELQILIDNNIITKENMIKEDAIGKMEKYSTMNIIRDIKDKEYESEISPDIPGFIRQQLDEQDKLYR